MLTIKTIHDAQRIVSQDIAEFCALRCTQLFAAVISATETLGQILLVEPGHTIDAIEKATGCWIATDVFSEAKYGDEAFSPCFELLEEHAACYEMAFVLNDEGYFVALIIPKHGVDAQLLKFCAEYAAKTID